MDYLQFEAWVESHKLIDGDSVETIELLALVGIAWFEEASKKRPGLTLDDVAAAMFEGSYMAGH